MFRRRVGDRLQGYSVRGIVSPRGSRNPFQAARLVIWAAETDVRTSNSIFSSWGHGMRILDDHVSYDAADYGFSGSPTMLITGTRADRLFWSP